MQHNLIKCGIWRCPPFRLFSFFFFFDFLSWLFFAFIKFTFFLQIFQKHAEADQLLRVNWIFGCSLKTLETIICCGTLKML